MKNLTIVLILMTANFANAQMRPGYTQYVLNNYIINPAVAGIENYTDVKLSHRHQWVGIQDAPVTTYVTIHGPIGKNDDRSTATSFDMANENPRGRQFSENYESAKPHHGWGMQMINDQTGPLNRFSLYGTYAYHIGISPRTSIAAGFSAGFTNNSLNTGKLIFETPVDPAVAGSGYLNKIRPDINAGVWLYSADFFAGISAMQILQQGLEFSNNTLGVKRSSYPTFFVTAGYKFYLDDDFSLLPSFVVRSVEPLPLGVDMNAKVQYRDLIWAGASYRFEDGFAGMFGVNVNHTFNISYAYDYSTSRLQTFTSGTHEIVLGFLLGNKYGDWCPRNLW